MPHLHYAIDYAVGAFIVNPQRQVLLIDHRKLRCWICPGGHVELNEDPEQAIYREVREETGLEIQLLGAQPTAFQDEQCKALVVPRFLDIHQITPTHRHVGLFWIARAVGGHLRIEPSECAAFAWYSALELPTLPRLRPSICHYALTAILEGSPP